MKEAVSPKRKPRLDKMRQVAPGKQCAKMTFCFPLSGPICERSLVWSITIQIQLLRPASQLSVLLKVYLRNSCSSRLYQRIFCSRCTNFKPALATGGPDRDVLAQPILLPPAREQERIVVKLNSALSGVERAETAARRARKRLQHYRAAVLHAAVTGELTRDWREAQRKNKKTEPESGEALLQRLLTVRRTRWEEAELQRLRAAGKEPKDDEWKARYPEPSTPNITGLP